MSWRSLIDRPGRPGPWGALLDEEARAAEDFLRVVETFDERAFGEERPSDDPDCRSPRRICLHVAGAGRRYADYILKARGRPHVERWITPDEAIRVPADVRPQVADALRYTEGALDGLDSLSYEEMRALEFQVRWGPRYDPEMILEHAVCHFLRHRRQLERWRDVSPSTA